MFSYDELENQYPEIWIPEDYEDEDPVLTEREVLCKNLCQLYRDARVKAVLKSAELRIWLYLILYLFSNQNLLRWPQV